MGDIRCENRFCIYWKNGLCILDRISLDQQGMCSECILIEMEELARKRARETALSRWETEIPQEQDISGCPSIGRKKFSRSSEIETIGYNILYRIEFRGWKRSLALMVRVEAVISATNFCFK